MSKRKIVFSAIMCTLFFIMIPACSSPPPNAILYSTDLSINGDFDDYFDLVAMQTLKNTNLNIIIDGNDMQSKESGVSAIDNLSYIGEKLPPHAWKKQQFIRSI